jgi:hypothetical protein
LGNHPSKNKLYNAGPILREVRSPVPPKITNIVGSECVLVLILFNIIS